MSMGRWSPRARTALKLGEMDAAANPDQLVQLFLDDDNEWAPVRIALFRVYSSPLTAAEVKTISASPFTSTVGLPAPGFQSSGIVNSASFSSANAITPGRVLQHLRHGSGRRLWRLGAVVREQCRSATLEHVRVLVNDLERSSLHQFGDKSMRSRRITLSMGRRRCWSSTVICGARPCPRRRGGSIPGSSA